MRPVPKVGIYCRLSIEDKDRAAMTAGAFRIKRQCGGLPTGWRFFEKSLTNPEIYAIMLSVSCMQPQGRTPICS